MLLIVGAAVKEIQNIISGVVEIGGSGAKYTVPTDDSQLLDEPEHKDNADGLIGTRLFDRSGMNLINKTWNILIEYDKENNEVDRYGSGYYWLKKGETYVIDGETIEFKNDYVVDYAKSEYTVLSGRAVNWNEDSTLAVTEGLVLNVDPMSLADGEWINNDTKKTYKEELAEAQAIEGDEARNEALNVVNTTFYNFWVTNPVTGVSDDTYIQKTGDVVYDENTKSIKFNEDEVNNPDGEGGYLK
ncbi:MAG: hypothetical protein IJ867_00385, partial [Clostridia bacterium]|nr:hypothetical protein [Clostridia bacterium]